MQFLPFTLRVIVLSSLALSMSRSPLQACTGDQYWEADPEGTLTWYKRGPEIPMRVSLARAYDVIQRSFQNAALALCDAPEKDLVSQKVRVVRAFRTDVVHTRIPAGFVTYQDYSQLMVRVIDRGGGQYAAEILTRSKWGRGRAQPAEVADQKGDCAAAAIAGKVRANLAPLK
jgi:hypothetical protein